MKREIKFRVWDIEARRMFWFDLLWGNHNTGNGYVGVAPWGEPQSKRLHRDNMWLVDPTECEIMQFTGLKDKNGKEIYEGDIVFIPSEKNMVIGWSERHASFVIERDGWAFVHYFGEAFEASECEVIGNIYENSDLLK